MRWKDVNAVANFSDNKATLPLTRRIIGLIRLGRIPMLPDPQNQHAHGKQHDAERRHQHVFRAVRHAAQDQVRASDVIAI